MTKFLCTHQISDSRNKFRVKSILTTTIISIVCLLGLYTYFTWGGNGKTEPPPKESENVLDLFEKANANRNKKATEELTKPNEILKENNNPININFEGTDYDSGIMYYNRAVKYINENNDVDALDCTMKALVIFRRLGLEEDSVFTNCTNLLPAIEKIADKKNATY